MQSEGFQRAERLFHEALSLPSERRAPFIEQAAGDDRELAQRVRRMVSFADQPSATAGLIADPFQTPGGSHSSMHGGGDLIGATLGPYRIVEVIGEGGFGVVYRARQEQPIQRSVALKVVRSGMDSQQVIARFEGERQALALMEHPNIARVLDAGRTPPPLGSRPYFAMELVDGAPITEYCDQRRLDADARLELFITVCEAVQHAHQKGIIHRDLKPSNILVSEFDGRPTPKVIDFGIAKALERRLTERTLVTEARQLLGTPQYMSPEQADFDAQRIDTRSDIYSLGVILYELLTGSTPLESAALRQASYSRMQRMIQEEAVQRPSTRVTRGRGEAAAIVAQLRDANVAGLQRRLKGDLDWIVLKALDHERERRYSSAAALADDLRRHQRHEPVQAGPPGAAYRVRKFVRRNRVAVLAAAFVGLAVVGGAVGTTLGMLRARDSAEQAQAVNVFMGEVLRSANPESGGAEVRLVEVLAAASDKASERFEGHPELEAEVRDMLGGAYVSLSLLPQSESEYRRAVALWQQVAGPDSPRALNAMIGVATAMTNQERGRDAEQYLGDDFLSRVDRAFSPDARVPFEARGLLGALLRTRGRLDESERLLEDAYQRAVSAGIPDQTQIRLLGTLIATLRTKLDLAEDVDRSALLGKSLPLARELVTRTEPMKATEPAAAYSARQSLAELAFLSGDLEEAATLTRRLLEESRDRLGECHAIRMNAMITLARAASRLGDSAESADQMLQALACARRSTSAESPMTFALLSDALPCLDRAGRWADGEACARDALRTLERLGGAHFGTFEYETYLAGFVSQQGRRDEAEAMYAALIAREKEIENEYVRAQMRVGYATHLAARGRFEDAEQWLLSAVALTGDVRAGTRKAYPDDIIAAFIALYRAWGDPTKAEQYAAMRDETLRAAISQHD